MVYSPLFKLWITLNIGEETTDAIVKSSIQDIDV
jgi:hypothetical protein